MSNNRTARPSAQKRPKAVAPIDAAERALRRLLVADSTGPSDSSDSPGSFGAPLRDATGEFPSIAALGSGVEPPVYEWVDFSQALMRYFAFIDVCGFTAYTDQHGTHAAIEVLTRFRSACRDVAGRRGVRVAKWLGDGVMLVCTEPGPLIATAAELLLRFEGESFKVHGGVAGGPALLFEGDDYIGRPANLASRLCDAAAPGEMLCSGLDADIPDWVERGRQVTVRAMGIGDITGVTELRVNDTSWKRGESAAHQSAS